MKITKTYTMKAGSLEDNCLKGSGNVMGQIDRGGDLVFPGFFKNAIPGFLKSGFMPVGHDWGGLPIAMPVKAAEQGNVLYCEFEFHSTDRAQEARVIAQERMEKGLDVGLSVGFDTSEKGIVYFPSGAKALEHAKELGCDMSLFDTKQVTSHGKMCRGLLPGGCSELFEISYVTVPMSQGSNATMVKGMTGRKPLEDLRPSSAFIEKYGPVENWTQKEWWEWLNGSQDDLQELAEAEPETKSDEETPAASPVKAAVSIATVRQFEEFLRDAGFSRKQATAIATHGYNSLRDAGEPEPTPEPITAPVIDAATAASRERAYRLLSHRSEGLRLANL